MNQSVHDAHPESIVFRQGDIEMRQTRRNVESRYCTAGKAFQRMDGCFQIVGRADQVDVVGEGLGKFVAPYVAEEVGDHSSELVISFSRFSMVVPSGSHSFQDLAGDLV